MATINAKHYFGHGAISGWRRATLLALGLLATGVMAIAVVDDGKDRQTHAVAASAARDVHMTSFDAALSPERPMPANDHYPQPAQDTNGAPSSSPRECLLEKGIVDDCTFN